MGKKAKSSAFKEEIMLAEWKALRNEINKRQEFTERIVFGLLAATFAILKSARFVRWITVG